VGLSTTFCQPIIFILIRQKPILVVPVGLSQLSEINNDYYIYIVFLV